MATVELAAAAVEDLDALIATQSLPGDTRARVARSLRALRRFPLMGPELAGHWEGFRFLLGSWRWLLLIYVYLETEDRVVVRADEALQEARTAHTSVWREPPARAYEVV